MSTSSPFVLQQDADDEPEPAPWLGPAPTVSNPRALQAAEVDKASQLRMQKTMSSSSPFILQGGNDGGGSDEDCVGRQQYGAASLAPTVSKPTMSEQLQMQKTMYWKGMWKDVTKHIDACPCKQDGRRPLGRVLKAPPGAHMTKDIDGRIR